MEQQNYWLLICNPKYYDFKGAFRDLDTIFWKQTPRMKRMQPGDIGFVYITRPFMRVMYMVEIINVGLELTKERKDKDADYTIGTRSTSDIERCVEIKLISACDDVELGIDFMRENGFTGTMQAPRFITNPELIVYLKKFF